MQAGATGATFKGFGGNDTLTGGAGNDTLSGGTGNDSLSGGGGVNTVSFADATSGVNVNLTTGTASGQGSDTLTGFTRVEGSGHADTITGSASADTLTGGAGNDSLSGMAGNDSLDGGGGDDFLRGGDGADTLSGGDGFDTFYYGATSEMGDSVIAFHWGFDVFKFENDAVADLGTGTLEAGRFFRVDNYAATPDMGVAGSVFIYDLATDALYYDSDGSDTTASTDKIILAGDVGFAEDAHSEPTFESIHIVDLA
jgi:Ca2+-binding RTX toxin-like protein